MDSLNDILSRKDLDEPPEVQEIKRFVQIKFRVTVKVAVQNNNIVVTIPNASLANTLRLNLPELSKAANTDKKIILRIGH